jgi:hypothetical protein
MAISGIQAAASPPSPKNVTTNDLQKAAAAKANAQVKQPESSLPPAKKAAPAANAERVSNQQQALKQQATQTQQTAAVQQKPPPPSLNTSGQVIGTKINTTA